VLAFNPHVQSHCMTVYLFACTALLTWHSGAHWVGDLPQSAEGKQVLVVQKGVGRWVPRRSNQVFLLTFRTVLHSLCPH